MVRMNRSNKRYPRSNGVIRRYTMITLGGLALAFTFIRIFLFKLPETPRYLLSQGKDQEAVDTVNYVARQNGKPEPLTIGMLRDIDIHLGARLARMARPLGSLQRRSYPRTCRLSGASITVPCSQRLSSPANRSLFGPYGMADCR